MSWCLRSWSLGSFEKKLPDFFILPNPCLQVKCSVNFASWWDDKNTSYPLPSKWKLAFITKDTFLENIILFHKFCKSESSEMTLEILCEDKKIIWKSIWYCNNHINFLKFSCRLNTRLNVWQLYYIFFSEFCVVFGFMCFSLVIFRPLWWVKRKFKAMGCLVKRNNQLMRVRVSYGLVLVPVRKTWDCS